MSTGPGDTPHAEGRARRFRLPRPPRLPFRLPAWTATLTWKAAVFIAVNWLVYIWAISNDRVVDASLGYYLPDTIFFGRLGVTHTDTEADCDRLADKVRALRVFEDADGKMNEALGEREILCVSQFTLYGDTRKGNRPSYVAAAPGDVAEPLYERFRERLGAQGGVFGADVDRALHDRAEDADGNGRPLRRLVTRTFTPDRLLRRLTSEDIAGVHFFTFNELERTERWRRRALT